MTASEFDEMERIRSPHAKYWQPIQWTFQLLKRAKEESKLADGMIYVDLLEVSGFQRDK